MSLAPDAHDLLADLLAWDREHLWHPYTSMADPTPVRLVTEASGARLRVDDREVVDAMASWWTAIHGYRHPVLDAAVREQLDSMSHVMFGGLTHEPAIGLARRLVEITPDGLEHVFLADSGSVSVEVALKMAMQYQRGRGRTGRTRMLTVRGGYHGDTCGCMGVCDPDGGMHATWRGFLPEHVFAPQPPRARGTSATYDARVEEDEHAAAVAAWTVAFEQAAAVHAAELAGIVVEPILQGAGGMHPYDAECLRVARRVADEHDLVLVCDEIATGFGRTGTLFACEAAGVVPDVLCVGKALTGGYLTLAAALCTREVAHTISRSEAGVLMHGPTFMGNPLACAVASASVELLLAGDWASTVARVGRGLRTGLAACGDLPAVVDVRTLGAVGVVELDHDVDVVKATEAALAEGVWLRPFRNLVYTMPPYVASDDEVAAICRGVRAAAEAG
jgi:adenosylmethionine-8-amino-7-oxononanoate aminotransferase